MGELGGKILILVAILALFVVLVVGKLSPSIDGKGDEVITEINGTSTDTVTP